MTTLGPIEGTVQAISRELFDMAGYAVTRLTGPVTAGATVWPVESTVDFPSSGTVIARGTRYTFTAKTPVTLAGLQYTDGVTVFNGAKIDLRTGVSVTDYSRSTTAMDLLRRSFLVDTAEGADLDVVGRNLGVSRLPGVSDTVYRAVIKALAYNPRGTVYGIQLLLDALLGSANYELFEDLPGQPNKVFIRLLGAAALNNIFLGKGFLQQQVLRPEDSATAVTISGAPPIETVYSVSFKDEDLLSDFRNQLPSADSLVEYPGDAGTTIWAYSGPSEVADVTQVAGLYVEIDDSSGADVAEYLHNARIQPESVASLSVLQGVSGGSTISATATDANQWRAVIQDGARSLAWGILANGADYDIGFLDIAAGTFIGSAAVTAQTVNTFIDVELRKNGSQPVELWIDGLFVASSGYTNFPATTETRFIFGAGDTSVSTLIGQVKQVGFFSRTTTDFWASRGTAGEAFPGATDDKTIEDTVASMFLAGDVGSCLGVSGSVAATGSSMTGGAAAVGRNNGTYVIDSFVSADQVTVVGQAKTGGFVQTGTPTTFFANDSKAFRFPEDLGKEVVISGAANPVNDGTFVVADLISEADGVTSLLTGDTPFPETTGIAILTGATFVTETGIDWRLDPVFVNETGLSLVVSDTGTEAAGVLTLRQSMPALSGAQTRILRLLYTDVLSGQLLAGVQVSNLFVGPGATDYAYFPFYLSDPLGVVRSYLDIITAAGVIPELLE